MLNVRFGIPEEKMEHVLGQPFSDLLVDVNEIISITPQEPCPVCYNLDPLFAPEDGNSYNQPWAKLEYELGADVKIGKIIILDVSTLITAAHNGCIYCCTVGGALELTRPDWHTEKTYLHIHVATDLPIVIRLHVGASSAIDLEDEFSLAARGVYASIPSMRYTISVGEATKPPIDVELYRPVIPETELTVGDVALAPLVQQIPRTCMDDCITNHGSCKTTFPPRLPDRVIWIAADNWAKIRLVEGKDKRAPYIALSYCWGTVSPDVYLTTADNLEDRKEGMDFEDLPPLIQDVVGFARLLGIQYIWIDRLCILQGEDADFKLQAPKMGKIYGNATLTIAAASANSEADHIRLDRDEKWRSYNLPLNLSGLGSINFRCRCRTCALGTEAMGGDYGRVSARAWIWQERLLATRTVLFTEGALKFECRHHSRWEGFYAGTCGPSWSAQLDGITHDKWMNLVEEFTKRDITRPSDRLPAMEAVMKRIALTTGWEPLCDMRPDTMGLWAEGFVESLAWNGAERGNSGHHECCVTPEYYAPTYSWASIDGPVSYTFARQLSANGNSDETHWDLKLFGVDQFTGLVRVIGRAVALRMRCQVVANELYEPSQPGSQKYLYYYSVTKGDNGDSFPVKADVPLQSWYDRKWRKRTVVRVPYGQSPPTKSFEAECGCLLLARRGDRALVLFLGGSQRVRGEWERVGMVDGMSAELFSGVESQQLDIA